MIRWLRYALGLPKSKWNSTFTMTSPFLSEWTDFLLERPGIRRLLVKLPICFGDRRRIHETAGIKIVERVFSLAFPDPVAHPCGIHAGVDNQMSDVDIPWSQLARRALGNGAQAKFGARKCGIATTA